MIRELCSKYTSLTDSDIAILEDVASHNIRYALLSGCDVFIDCFIEIDMSEEELTAGEELAVVVAHARPETSQYPEDISGYIVHSTIEPIVFRVAKYGMPMRDDKVVTMEGAYVHQRATPINNEEGKLIGVLIQESDITEVIATGRKLESLVKSAQRLGEMQDDIENTASSDRDVMLRETHHRIKNNLQVIYSILSMQARRVKYPETRKMLEDDLNVINCIAMMHEALSVRDDEVIDMNLLVSRMIAYYKSILAVREKYVEIRLTGDQIYLKSDKASSLTLIINELVTNSLNHAFGERYSSGRIDIIFSVGNSYMTVRVADNGKGYDASEGSKRLGLNLLSQIAHLELKSELVIKSQQGIGTVSSVTFK